MDISIEKLKLITDRVFDYIVNDLGIEKISLDQDYYWNIPMEFLFDMDVQPSELDIGQLYEDWEFLSEILEDKQQAVPLMFMHLAPLLRYISENVGKQDGADG